MQIIILTSLKAAFYSRYFAKFYKTKQDDKPTEVRSGDAESAEFDRINNNGSWGHEPWREEFDRINNNGSWGHEPWRWSTVKGIVIPYSVFLVNTAM